MGRKLALIIGNTEYRDKSLPRLNAPAADIHDLHGLLKAKQIGGFDDVQVLPNRTFSKVYPTIASFFANKSPDDLLLFYFSGHGVVDEQGLLYLALKDTRHNLLSGTAISSGFLKAEMDHSRSKRQVVILDCCCSGAFARGTKAIVEAKAITDATFEGQGHGRVVLTATDTIQAAWEGDQVIKTVETSLFTHYLIEGLKTGAADVNGDGRVTPDELYDYVFGKVVDATPNQKPRKIVYDQQGEIIIARNPHPPAAKSSLVDEGARLFADAFRANDTSRAYYNSAYFQKHRHEIQPVPVPFIDPPRIELADIIGRPKANAIQDCRKITFHAVGDTAAARQTAPSASVIDMMVADVRAGGERAPAFFFHLGDVVFHFGESQFYFDQFYAPFRLYDRPIFAIPGNHDGAVHGTDTETPAVPTLQAFLQNFCARAHGPSSDARGIRRSVMTQPGVYFTLDAPMVSIIGLYSNVLSGPGVISSQGGRFPISDDQLKFLQAELLRLKPSRVAGKRAVIVAVHHPPLSADRSRGSTGLSNDIDKACMAAGLWPDAILSAHAHVYQRFTRRVGKRQMLYFVCGTGGYGLSKPPQQTPKTPFTLGDYTLEVSPVFEFGYLTITIDMASMAKEMTIAFHSPKLGRNVDEVTLDLGSGKIKAGS
jgi:hypothetical protein